MPKIYALLVGINEYDPNSKVPRLRGCENDVDNFEKFLEATYPSGDLDVATLKGKGAKYQDIITTFRSHFKKAEKGDIALFHFSGHGARELAPKEYKNYFPEGKQETLVCYDSRTKGGFDLADKELGFLLDEVSSKGVSTVVCLDCCHSGSGTRSIDDYKLGRPRQWDDRNIERPLNTYLNGELILKDYLMPTGKHILLAACDKKEKAFELTNNTGNFTSHLLEVLEANKGVISYANLYAQTRIKMHLVSKDQNPQFETQGFFNSYGGFLGAEGHDTSVPFKLSLENYTWKLNAGAVHGLPNDGKKQGEIEIYYEEEFIGNGKVVGVGFEESEIEIGNLQLDDETIYDAKITSIQKSKTIVFISGNTDRIQKIMDSEFSSVHFELSEEHSEADYKLDVDETEIQVIRQVDNKVLRFIEGNDDEKVFKCAFECLEHVCKWEQSLVLQNDGTAFDKDLLKMQIVFLNEEGKPIEKNSDPEMIVEIIKNGNEEQKVPFLIEAVNNSDEELYVSLFYYSYNYGVRKYYSDKIPPNSKSTILERQSSGKRVNFFLDNDYEALDIFKILVSRKSLSAYTLEQDKIKIPDRLIFWVKRNVAKSKGFDEEEKDRGIESQPDPNDWYTQTIKVKSVARLAKVGKNELSLNDGVITIHSNENLVADVSLGKASSGSRSVEQSDILKDFAKATGVELLSLSNNTRSLDAPNILSLSNIKGADNLKSNPLKIDLNVLLKEEEMIMPFTFDGEHFIPVGNSEKNESGTTQITIDHIPEEKRTRNIGRALKLCFLRLIGKKKVNMLRWVDFDQQGEMRKDDGLVELLKTKKKVLLLIHGIIGDTKGQAEFMRKIKETSPFDLVLTYDYENLNRPIQDTALDLSKDLAAKGINETSGHEVTILAHSMGGLVSRYYIEKLDGSKIVKHLIMAGTPNQGSAFSKIADYHSYALLGLGVAANSIFNLPAAAATYAILKPSKKLFPTLKQMAVGSDFITGLNTKPITAIPYSIIAGNIFAYMEKDNNAKILINKLLKIGATLFYKDQPNDLAVSVESIKDVSGVENLETVEVACHHMNYFEEEESVNSIFKSLC